MIDTCETLESPLGTVYVTFAGKQLTSISFIKPSSVSFGKVPGSFIRQLKEYFEGTGTGFDQELSLQAGTKFERKVWLALSGIPYGQTRSYKWLAGRVGLPGGSRAVGQALSKNPIPIVLPCHRIIESGGGLGGYSSGIRLKRRLLDLEYYRSVRPDQSGE